MDIAAANTRAARAFVRGLIEAGVTDVCISPGSRSTPLTVAFAEQRAVRPWLHLDERSSAFFALGLARAKGQPVALVCTSGTAAANYLPAVVEANLSRVPLVVCTTDRPPRLRDNGAPQAIDQVKLYGTQVRWAADLPLPTNETADESRFAGYAERAVRAALGVLPGPVHMNLPFDEPLLGAPGEHPAPVAVAPAVAALSRPGVAPAAADVRAVARRLGLARWPIIIAGPETGGLPAEPIARLSAELNAPIFADPLSGLRTGPHDRSRVCDSYDALVRDVAAVSLVPGAIVRFGGPPTSKALNQYVARFPTATHIVVDLPGSYRDPLALNTQRLEGDPGLVADALAAELAGLEPAAGLAEAWMTVDARARAAMQSASAAFTEPFEGRVFVELQRALPPGATIFASNSMPVRDLDSFVVSDPKPLTFVSNRGANGIDGVTSSALGHAAAGGGPVALVIGDIAFYHDLNGLWAAKRHGLDLTIVLVNNNGGGIFHYLPQAAHDGLFEEWFGTPPDLDFRPVVEMYGGRFTLADDWATFAKGLDAARAGGLHVLELRTDRARNVAMHREAWAAAADAAWRAEAVAAP
ncbi:MAG: 2-succinyl-5-enolpyruvyl-6-hydroxy-3-cyclohexene-1-carboxylic-acid synthase [Dehalococcoidia bacterium]|nr:2-succinyl-5-enolpyruvyl-6-hydroxy-3-cyclohexene-1-carboxylic-acid synthase [Dehalococcoidia bacterium]